MLQIIFPLFQSYNLGDYLAGRLGIVPDEYHGKIYFKMDIFNFTNN